jgi:ElaA protein
VIRSAPTATLPLETLYAILRLRQEVFVVEQDCPYLDADGRDLEPGCVQLWIEEDGAVVATARLLTEPDGHRIGRVCTTPAARSRGLGATVVEGAIALAGSGPVVIDAQSQLTHGYGGLGFVATGHEFVEDGIHHTEMRRP